MRMTMTKRPFRIGGCLVAVLLALPMLSLAAAPAETTTATGNSVREATKLLHGIAADARMVRMHARKAERLSKEASPTWSAYDHQWNAMAPNIEDMSMKLGRLQGMRASLPDWQQQAIDHTAPLIREVAGNSKEFRTFLNEHGSDLTNPMFGTYAGKIFNASREIAQTAGKTKNS